MPENIFYRHHRRRTNRRPSPYTATFECERCGQDGPKIYALVVELPGGRKITINRLHEGCWDKEPSYTGPIRKGEHWGEQPD